MLNKINHSPNTEEDSVYVTELISMLRLFVNNGQVSAAFQIAMEYCRAYDNFEDAQMPPEEREAVRQNVIEFVKRQLGKEIRAQNQCCGQPLNVSGVYELQRHSLLIRCDSCGKATTVEENADYDH